MTRDPITLLKKSLIDANLLTEEQFKQMDQKARDEVIAAMQFAEESPWPDPMILEQGVFAPKEPD